MANHWMGRVMREKWDDPEWAAAQRRRIREAYVRRNGPTKGYKRSGRLAQFAVYMDHEMAAALRVLAAERKMGLSELIRLYIEWGLEAEKPDYDEAAFKSP